jgi:hypothetical protein
MLARRVARDYLLISPTYTLPHTLLYVLAHNNMPPVAPTVTLALLRSAMLVLRRHIVSRPLFACVGWRYTRVSHS